MLEWSINVAMQCSMRVTFKMLLVNPLDINHLIVITMSVLKIEEKDQIFLQTF